MNISHKIKTIRELKGYSQQYVAEKLNMSQSAYSKLESSEVHINLEKLKKVLGILDFEIYQFLQFDEKGILTKDSDKKDNMDLKKEYEFLKSKIHCIEKELFFLKSQVEIDSSILNS